MKSASKKMNTEHLSIRVSPEQKERIRQLAQRAGISQKELILSALEQKASERLGQSDAIVLSEADAKVFFEALSNPPEPNEKLKEAAQLYREYMKP